MQLSRTNESPLTIDADAVVACCFADLNIDSRLAAIDRAMSGAITRLIEAKEITGKSAEVTTLLAPVGLRARRLIIVGLGERDGFDVGSAFQAAAAVAKAQAGKAVERVAYFFEEGLTAAQLTAAACGAVVGAHGQDLYRAEKKLTPPKEIHWATSNTAALLEAQELAAAVNLTRKLVNEPPSEMFPQSFAAEAERVAGMVGIKCEVWDETRLEQEGCGSLLAVARGSDRPPRLVILRYQGGPADAPVLGLVGKGVTFDSGGLSIKPTDSMTTMKCDMAGAATVLGAMHAIARLKLPVNVMGFMGLVENLISGRSYKLGDVLQARSGKTIEVLNTDAEGRLVLADVLDVAVERGAAKLIDLATLTGSCMVALGLDVAGVMTNDQTWCKTVMAAAEKSGEPVWQLPMFKEYAEQIKSKVADIKNVGEGRWGGAITAAKFLEEFVGGKPWVHLDIAGPAFLEHEKPHLDAGGSGIFVRTLVQVARDWNG